MPVNTEPPEEELLDHLEYVMACASENILGECKYELDKLIVAINNSQPLAQDQKDIAMRSLDIIHDLLKANMPDLVKVNNLFWKLHKTLRDVTFAAIRKSCGKNMT